MSFFGFVCPHCECKAIVRSSEQISRVTKEQRCVCQNPECGHTFVVISEVVRTLSTSACPHPDVNLPIRDQLPERRKPAGPGYAAMNVRRA